VQLVVDQRTPSITLELTTPTRVRHFKITRGELAIADPATAA
jgi:hypothetical protein